MATKDARTRQEFDDPAADDRHLADDHLDPVDDAGVDVSTADGGDVDGDLPLAGADGAVLAESFVGREFAGFDVLGVAGKGGMGLVFKARHISSGRLVALKVLPVLTRRDREPIRRFLSEVEVLARLDHPNITRIHTMGRRGHVYYLATEFVRGRTVAKIIDRHGGFSVTQALLVARGVAEALSLVHQHGIVHRDIKSDNLMIDHEGVVKVLDFGIAQDLRAKKRITVGDTCLGNPEYCSPEQLSTGVMDERTDIYSLGIVLFEMLTGEVPYHGMPTLEIYMQKRKNKTPSLSRKIPGAPRSLRRLIKKMIAPKPERRFASMEEVADAIEDILPTLGEFGRSKPSADGGRGSKMSGLVQRVVANLF